MKTLISTVAALLCTTVLVSSQNVAINTTGTIADASAMLDVNSTSKGILVPRVVLTATNVAAPVTAPLNSLLVYNSNTNGTGSTAVTPGYYYWDGTASLWRRLMQANEGWGVLGNIGTTAGTNFAGTVDNVTFDIRTNNTLRARIWNTGEMVVNNAGGVAGDVFSSYAAGGNFAVNGYAQGTGASVALYAENTSTGAGNTGLLVNTSTNANSGILDLINTGAAWGIWSDIQNVANTHPGIAGVTRNLTSTGVAGAVNGTSTITILIGGSGGAFISPSTGVYATATNASSNGALFSGNGVGAGGPTGGSGSSSNGAGIGVYGSATTVASGTGGVFAGNNSGYSTLAGGSGVAGTGTTTGVFGTASTAASGTGGVFGGNNLATTSLATGSGVAGTGANVGVFGYIPNNALTSSGGLFMRNGGTFAVAVSMNNAGTDFKILGTGAVSTIVKNTENKDVIMFAPESPEMLFQDFGKGKLVNGFAKIEMDPSFAKNIFVDDEHPLKVFVQLEGDCNGVYIANKTATGFEVKELNGGTSNAEFTWFANGNRIDRKDENGNVISKNQDVRFPQLEAFPGIVTNEHITGHTIIEKTQEVKKENSIQKDQKQLELPRN